MFIVFISFSCLPVVSGDSEDKFTPTLIPNLRGHRFVEAAISTGESHTLLLEDTGQLHTPPAVRCHFIADTYWNLG